MFRYFLLFLFLIPTISCSQNKISGNFSPADEYDFVLLYRIKTDKKIYVADTTIDNQGVFELNPENFEPGVYKLVYKLPEETYNFDIIYNGKEEISFSFIKGQGVVFNKGQNKVFQDYMKEMTSIDQDILKGIENSSSKEKINKLFEKQRNTQSKYEKESDDFTREYISAMKPYIPEIFKNKAAFEINKKSNYFDNFDFNNKKLQASSFPLFLIKKYYYEYVTLNDGNGYREAINDIVRETKSSDISYNKSLMADFWIYLTLENRQNAATYLAQKYLLSLAKAANDKKMTEELEQILSASVGAKAPDFELRGYDVSKTLYDLTGSDYYLLIFWSTECSHCVAQVPVIHEEMKTVTSEKLKTVAVGIEIDNVEWKKMTKDFTEFINVLALDEWRNNLTLQYNITGTPTFFILDANKQIVSTPKGTENLLNILESIKNYQK